MMQEQAMIMSALNISVSKHLIDEHYTCVLANEYYYKLIGYSKARYEALFHNTQTSSIGIIRKAGNC